MLEQIKQLYPLPFKFLDSYDVEDKNIFFGREEETEALNIKVSENRITLVYGLSGSGKTSLVNCGLANRLGKEEWEQFIIRRDGNFIKSMAGAINKTAHSPINHKIETPEEFKKACRHVFFTNNKSLFFVFDQFEELFIFGDKEEKESFAKIIETLNKSHLNLRFVFVLREEFLARMTELEKTIPSIFSCRMRVETMTPDKARETIEKPCKFYGIKLEKGFADAVLNNLNKVSNELDLAYLQLYLDRVYQLALSENDDNEATLYFHRKLLEQTGNMSDLLGRFLDEQIGQFRDKEKVTVVLKSLVSDKGTKRQMTISEITGYLESRGQGIEENLLLDIIRRLINVRILHEKDHNERFELRHDVLATKIYKKITSVEKEQLEISQMLDTAWYNYTKRNRLLTAEDLSYIALYEDRMFFSEDHKTLINKSKNQLYKAKKQKQKITAAFLAVLLLVLTVFSTWALFEKNKAERNEMMFRAGYFNSLANKEEAIDPTRALRLVEYAHSLHPHENITRNLHRIYASNSFYTQILHLPNPPYDILAMSLAPDGQSLITGHWQGKLKHYDTQGNLIREFIGHKEYGNLTSVSFSPDGKLILSNSFDGKMILWSHEGEMLNILEEPDFIRHDGSINLGAENIFHHSSFAPDGKAIAASDTRNGFLRFYDLKGEIIGSVSVPDLTSYDFLSGTKIISSTINGTIQTHDISGKRVSGFSAAPNSRHVAASPSGFHIAVAAGNTIHLFDADGNKKEEMTRPSGRITSIGFSKDGNYIIATTTDKKAIMWHISGRKVAELRNQQNILAATISADNHSIYAATYYGIDRYEVSGKLLHYTAIDALPSSQNHWITSADSGDFFLMVLENKAYVFDNNANIVATIDNKGKVADVFGGRVVNRSRGAFSACEKYVILSFGSHAAGIYDFKGSLIREITVHNSGSYINDIAISPEGNYVLTASQDSTAALWTMDGQIVSRLKHPDWVTAVAFSHNSQYLLTGDRSGTIRLWDINGNPVEIFPRKHQVQVTHLGFSEDNTKLWSFSDSGMRVLRVTDPEGIQHILTDGGKGDNFLHEWSIRGELLNSFDFNRELAARYAFSTDFKHILIGYNTTNAQLFNRSGHLLQSFHDHKGTVRAMASSPDGKTIVTADNQGVYFWESKTTYEMFHQNGKYESLSETDKIAFGIMIAE